MLLKLSGVYRVNSYNINNAFPSMLNVISTVKVDEAMTPYPSTNPLIGYEL